VCVCVCVCMYVCTREGWKEANNDEKGCERACLLDAFMHVC
jgi:hypothetical protein